jgi:putative tributyrin esterase
MALMKVHFFSNVILMMSTMNVIIPQDIREGEEIPVLWLLHGGGGNENDWIKNTSIERYAAAKRLAVIMPCAGYSRYCNMKYGGNYYDFLSQELPEICYHFFPALSKKREMNYIAGLSLGGSGAIYIGMRNPDKYGVIGVFSASSIIPLEYLRDKAAGGPKSPGGPGKKSVCMINFGVEDTNDLVGTEYDVLMYARKNVEEKKELPKVYHAVGRQDHAYPVGLGLKKFFEGFEGNPYHYEFHEAEGNHSWEFWDEWVRKFIDYLPDWKKEV